MLWVWCIKCYWLWENKQREALKKGIIKKLDAILQKIRFENFNQKPKKRELRNDA